MIELKFNMSDVDYEAAAELLLPLAMEQLSRSGENPLLGRFLQNSQGFGQSAAKAVLAKMSKETKDELLVKYINKNKNRINKMLTDAAASKGISVTVSGVEARTV